ncbi:MAG: hypothetical protein NVSMB49_23680 [Ktedonobacteraceae bacterium]
MKMNGYHLYVWLKSGGAWPSLYYDWLGGYALLCICVQVSEPFFAALRQTEVRATLLRLIVKHLDINECVLIDENPLLTYARDTQALTGLLGAIQQQFHLDVQEVLSSPLVASDLVACILAKRTASQKLSMANVEFREGIQ